MRARPLVLAALLLFTAVLTCGPALARPGGGGSYHGGGGGGGFHGGGGFGGGGFSTGGGYHGGGYSTGGPGGLVFFVLVAGVVVAIMVMRARAMSLDDGTRSALMSAQDEQTAGVRGSVSLDPLRARDPGLTEQSIVDHVQPMADMLREAWCGGDMRPARAFVSDGVFSRFQVQLALMRQENRRNVMGDARVLSATIAAVEDAPPLDVVHVRLTAEARDAEVPAGAGDEEVRRALARTAVEPYTEIWSLVRRSGAQTKPADFAVGRACPSCGAPLDGGEIIQCRYCKALVCSGEHDWVLAEITQEEEWHPTSGGAPGLAALRARDAGAAREVLEDRASFLFWKWVQAGRAGQLAPLRKHASAAMLEEGLPFDWLSGASDVAVGGADLLRCDLDGDDGLDRAYVEVFWSARFGGARAYTPVHSVLRLARKTGVASKLSMTALVCQACGAPLVESDSTKCDHCGAELAAGDQAWVLEAVLRPDQMPAPPRRAASAAAGVGLGGGGDGDDDGAAAMAAVVPDVSDPRERRVLFARMAQLMAADGAIAGRERRLLTMCAKRWGIPPEQVQAVLQSPPQGDYAGALAVASPQWFLAGLVAASLADGRIDARERALLEHACDALRLPHEAIDRQIAATAARLGVPPRA